MSRVTVSMPDKLEGELKQFADSQKKSVSKITSEAVEHYLNFMNRRTLGKKVLDLVEKQNISVDAIEELEAGRADCDSRI